MTELLAIGNDVWAPQGVQFRTKSLAMPAPGMSRPVSGTMLPQTPPQLDRVAVSRIC